MPKRKLEDEVEWARQKEAIIEAYINEDKSLKEVIHIMTNRGFQRTKPQYERTFRQWGVSKNVREEEWRFIFDRMEQRQRTHRTSKVYVRGNFITDSKLKNQKRKLRQTIFDRCLADIGLLSRAKTPPGIEIFTPPSSPVRKVEHSGSTTTKLNPENTTMNLEETQIQSAHAPLMLSSQHEGSREEIRSTTTKLATSILSQSPRDDHVEDAASRWNGLLNSEDIASLIHPHQSFVWEWPGAMSLMSSIHLLPDVIAETMDQAARRVSKTSNELGLLAFTPEQMDLENEVCLLMVKNLKKEAGLEALRYLLNYGGTSSPVLHPFAQKLLVPATLDENLPLVRLLLEAGVNPNARASVYTINGDMTALLLQHGATDWRAYFQGATGYVFGSIVDVVIEMGMHQEWTSRMYRRIQSLSHSVLEIILHFGSSVAQESHEMLLRAVRHAILRDRLDLVFLLWHYQPGLLETAKKTGSAEVHVHDFFAAKGLDLNAFDSAELANHARQVIGLNHPASQLEDADANVNGMALRSHTLYDHPELTIAGKNGRHTRGMTTSDIRKMYSNEILALLLPQSGYKPRVPCLSDPFCQLRWASDSEQKNH
ncbi:hypothetical protein DE146DRAFT_766218 [Phaeosphaeria sp. MPI-PUGE-AT-0046c]|nr:hypothetical protein DE146DRAFT_766218 [Phaeosphaeria sp. MPI-PUGE-AT-0046c]